MLYEWNKELETGNSIIDTQHKQLIQTISDLMNALKAGKGSTEIEKTMNFLANYTAKHFADEEKLQLQYNYPDYVNHKKMHEGFKQIVRELSQQFKQEGVNLSFITKVNKNIGDWLVTHIKREDKKIAEHIRLVPAK